MTEANLQDNLLLSLGSPGKLQVLLFVLLCTNAFPITFNFLFITFFGNIPPYHCKVPGNGSDLEHYIPKVKYGKTETWSKCEMYVDPENQSEGLEKCTHGYAFETQDFDWTIASEWNLACKDEYLSTLAATIFFSGVMIGGLVFGTLADKYGRKPIVLITLYGQAILGVIIAFSPNYIVFVILKFFQGSLLQGLQSSNNSLVMEMFPLRYRTLAAMILASCATSAHMLMAGLLFMVPYWNYMQLTISLLTSLTVFYTWLYPESIRWLLSKNRQMDALKTINCFAKVNKVKLPSDIGKQLEDIAKDIATKSNNVVKYSILDLFRTPHLRRYTLCLIFCWFSASVTYYGIQFFIPKMKGNQFRYLNLFISGAMETAARIVGYFIIDRLGRRRPLVFFYVGSGLFCIATGLMFDLLQMDVVSNVLAILGKLCSAQCFAFMLIFSSEIFPTVTRTIGLGLVACFTRIGAMIAPQILSLQSYVSLWVPFVIFGSLSLISSFLIMTMPETKGRVLPSSIEEVEEFAIVPLKKDDIEVKENRKVGLDNPALDNTTVTNVTDEGETLNDKDTTEVLSEKL